MFGEAILFSIQTSNNEKTLKGLCIYDFHTLPILKWFFVFSKQDFSGKWQQDAGVSNAITDLESAFVLNWGFK